MYKEPINTEFHENQSVDIGVFPKGEMDGQTDTTNLIVFFRNFANKPKNKFCYY